MHSALCNTPSDTLAGMDSPSAFRIAERTYKRFKGRPAETLPLDTVVDVRSADSRLWRVRDGVYELAVGVSGLYVLPAALSAAEQTALATDCLSQYIWPPQHTSLDTSVDMVDVGNLFEKLRDGRPLPRSMLRVRSAEAGGAPEMARAEALALVRRMRWATVGMHYDWTAKVYPGLADPRHLDAPFPPSLAALCERVAAPFAPGWRAQAGIINMYQVGDSLTGHVDRAEADLGAPIVSLSLGAPCVFLVGGPNKDDAVVPLLLRSGDAVVMAGEARLAYHGVPCVLKTDHAMAATDASSALALDVLGAGRINVNVRQVYCAV